MSDLLAIADEPGTDEHLVDEIRRRHPDRVTVLLDDSADDANAGDAPHDESSGHARARRDRLAKLIAAIEQRTGAVVVGFVRSRDDLRGWRFDRTVGASKAHVNS